MTRGLSLFLGAVMLLGCSGLADQEDVRAAAKFSDGGASDVSVDEVEVVHGVPDRGRDPSVVALAIGDGGLCTASLVSPRILLTARHCVSRTVQAVACPPSGVQVLGDRDPRSLTVLLGDDIASAHAVAHGEAIVAPAGVTLCGADIALVVLDTPVTHVKPLPVRTRGVTRGDRVRAVGFGRHGNEAAAGIKLLREHVRVLDVDAAEFTVGEATCQGDSGGPAIDESTGEIVGVVSRGGPSCEGADVHNIYTRVDAFRWLVDEAFARASGIADPGADAGAKPSDAKHGTKEKPASDMGGPCEKGADCAAGVCVRDGDRQYCSRGCGSGDRCPAHYHCQPSGSGSACIQVP